MRRLGVARAAVAAFSAAVSLGLVAAPAALADSSASTNWAGYAIHRSGVHFKKVVASWTQPHATCVPGSQTFSAVWTGLGGYSQTSKALEQIGTELDCKANGQAVSSTWYELVPSPSHNTRLIVHQGDRVRATVTVTGKKVKLTLNDLTRHRSFTKTAHVSVLDTSSAEWIVEAPSICTTAVSCEPLPLADFDSATITGASATTTKGHTGPIEDRRWDVSEISLFTPEPRFVADNGGSGASATPSPLSTHGNAFTVTYKPGTSSTGGGPATTDRVTDGRLVHPKR